MSTQKDPVQNFKQILEAEKQEANSPFNAYVTGIEVGHDPSPEEKILHYGLNIEPAHIREIAV